LNTTDVSISVRIWSSDMLF